MSQSVARLKELLFDDETQALADLARRIDAASREGAESREALAHMIASVSDADAFGRAELAKAVDELFARAVTTDRLADGVASVLNDALRKAEVVQHAELSASMAPLVVTTIRAELRNSQDEMVEALYPLTGRLVKAYVASAMKDLADQMNRSIEQTSVMMRLRSFATGQSMAELAMADTQDFEINDLLLIRRSTGELLAQWPDGAGDRRDQAMSGVLAAINEFADEALSADQDQLRQIDLGGHEVYLRGSPKFLLAARCSGTAPPSIGPLIDEAFLSALEKQHALQHSDGDDGGSARQSALDAIGRDMESQLHAETARLKRSAGRGALKTLAFVIFTPLACWLAYSWYDGFIASRARTAATQAVDGVKSARGYPVEIDIESLGRRITVSGLVPSEAARFEIAHKLRRSLPDAAVVDQLSIVPGAALQLAPQIPDVSSDIADLRSRIADVGPRQERVKALDVIDRCLARLEAARDDLARSGAAALTADRRTALVVAAEEVGSLRERLGEARAALSDATTSEETDAARGSLGAISNLIGPLATRIQAAALPAGAAGKGDRALGPDLVGANHETTIDALQTRTERLTALAAAASIAVLIESRPIGPPPIAPPLDATAREKLEAAVRAKAVFFTSGLEYRNAEAAMRTLAMIAPMIAEAGLLVRVVGYTDEAGGNAINSPLAQQRADVVRAELVKLGVPANLVAAVGRTDRVDISAVNGADSPNRRVEFEVGFDGEAAQ
ncbi:MAG: OmpA family protein [Hyphomicrobium sp.]